MNINKTIDSLKKNGYCVNFFECKEDATEYLYNQLSNKSIGFGDSQTIKALNLNEILSKHNIVYDPQSCKSDNEFYDIADKCLLTDIYITSVNALSESGELINLDGAGNRIAGSLYGHDKVYFVVGVNKIEDNIEKAIYRVRNVAAPQNAKRLGLKTPCAIKGDKCYDCSSKDRICNALVIHYKKMMEIEMEVILINEPLGL